MIPIGDVVPTRTRPVVTLLVIGWMAASVSASTLALIGGASSPALFADGIEPSVAAWLTTGLVPSLLMPGDPLQAFSNGVVLWLFGTTTEDRLGHGRFFVLYLAAGLSSVLADWTVRGWFGVAAGSTGAAAGILGAYFALFPGARVMLLVPARALVDIVEVPAGLMIGFWMLGQAAGAVWLRSGVGRVPISIVIPAAGLLVGVAAAQVLPIRRRLRVEWWSP